MSLQKKGSRYKVGPEQRAAIDKLRAKRIIDAAALAQQANEDAKRTNLPKHLQPTDGTAAGQALSTARVSDYGGRKGNGEGMRRN